MFPNSRIFKFCTNSVICVCITGENDRKTYNSNVVDLSAQNMQMFINFTNFSYFTTFRRRTLPQIYVKCRFPHQMRRIKCDGNATSKICRKYGYFHSWEKLLKLGNCDWSLCKTGRFSIMYFLCKFHLCVIEFSRSLPTCQWQIIVNFVNNSTLYKAFCIFELCK